MNRIISLLPSSTEIICAIGGGERLVGRSHECDYPSIVANLPICTAPKFDPDGTSYQIDQRVKAILQEATSVYRVDADQLDELAPDLLVTQSQCDVCAVSLKDVQEAACQLVHSQPTILSLEPNALTDVWHDIERVGTALGMEDNSGTLVTQLKNRLHKIATRVRKINYRPRVACIEWFEPLMAAGNWIPELVEISGGQNLFTSSGDHSPYLSWEAIEEAQPDIIILMPCGFTMPRSRNELPFLTQQPAWFRLRAVQQEQVFLTDGNQFFNRPGPRLVESAEILAEILHPQYFGCTHEHIGWERWKTDKSISLERNPHV
ncbi:MAG: cobalamin-binding protein [Gemmatimonadota bacterium]|nr:cobalamin-binding protein [Gemmatimonadota bacterium]